MLHSKRVEHRFLLEHSASLSARPGLSTETTLAPTTDLPVVGEESPTSRNGLGTVGSRM